MNKKILALAVGSALAMPMVAQAKVVVYGHAQVEIGNIDTGSSDQNFTTDNARGRIGIKASEKLGNGWTAFAKFEFRTNTSDGTQTGGDNNAALVSREQAIGIKGSFGTVEFGRIKTPYKYFGGVTYDPFVATTLEARGNGGQTGGRFGHNNFLSNSIGWKSNSFNGISVWAVVSIDEQDTVTTVAGAAADNITNGSDGDYSVGIRYKNGPLEVGVAVINDDSANLDRTKFFGQYKWGNHKVSLSYEDTDATTDSETYFIGYQLRSGNNTFVAQFGNTEPDVGSDTDYYAIGLIHHLSKKTRVFGGFRNTDAGAGGDTDVVSVGLRVIF